MKQSNDNNQQVEADLDDELASYVSDLKAELLSEDDLQNMESNLQQMIIAQGNREDSTTENSEPETFETREINLFEQLKAMLSRTFNWQSMRLVGSMGAVMAVVLTVVFMSTPSRTVFASVINQMQLASSMFYSSRIESGGQHLMDVKIFHRSSGQLRVETLPLGDAGERAVINVMNLVDGNGVIFFPGAMSATPFKFDVNNNLSSPDKDPLYWYEQLKNHQGEPSEILDAKEVGGVIADGFIIRKNGASITVWAGVDNHLPLKLIVTLDKVDGQIPFKMEADLQYNLAFDDALFSLEIGDGYEVSAEDAEHH